MIINSTIARAVLFNPDGGTGGGAGAAALETPGTASAVGDAQLRKMFPEDYPRTGQPAGEPGGTTDHSNAGEGGEGAAGGEGEGGEGAAGGEGEGGEGAAGGEGEGTVGGTPDPKNFHGVGKRVLKLLDKIEQLRTENDSLRAQAPRAAAAGVPEAVSRIRKPADLQALETTTKGNLREAQNLIRQLGYAAKNVERVMREWAANNPALASRFKKQDAESGQTVDDFSTEKMAEVLGEVEENLTTTLDAIPQRQQFLSHRSRVSRILREPEVLKVAPFVNDIESAEYEQVHELISNSADLQGAPNGEWLAVAAVLGMRQLNPAMGAAAQRIQGASANERAPGAGARPKTGPTRMPALPGSGGTRTKTTNYKQARAKFAERPGKDTLEAVLANL